MSLLREDGSYMRSVVFARWGSEILFLARETMSANLFPILPKTVLVQGPPPPKQEDCRKFAVGKCDCKNLCKAPRKQEECRTFSIGRCCCKENLRNVGSVGDELYQPRVAD